MKKTPLPSGKSTGPKSRLISFTATMLVRKMFGAGAVLAWRRVFLNEQWQVWLAARRRRVVWSLAVGLGAALVLLEILQLLFFLPAALTPLERGRQLSASGHYTDAAALLRQELQEHPRNNEARLLLARTLIALRQWPAASGYLSELLKTTPNDPQVYYWMGKGQQSAGNLEAAENSWRLLLSRADPAAAATRPLAHLALGLLRYRQSQYDESARLIFEALSGDLQLFEATELQQAFYTYGLLLARDRRFEDATAALQKALNVTLPGSQWDNAAARLELERTAEKARMLLSHLPKAAAEKPEGAKRARLAYAYLLAEEYHPAEEQLLQVVRVAPNYADALAYLGIVYWRTGRADRAAVTLNSALALAPASRLTRQALAEFILDRLPGLPEGTPVYKQESDRARQLLDSLVAEKPEDPALQVALARYFIVARHDYQSGQQHYNTALRLNKLQPVAGLNPGAVLARYYSENSFDPCVRGVDTALEATRDLPDDPESWYAAGLAYKSCGHPNAAGAMFEKALELRPYWTEALYRLALCYDMVLRTTEADRLFKLLADLDPGRAYHRR